MAARRVVGGVAVAALAGLVLAACDGDPGSADPATSSSSPSSSSSSTPTTVDEEAAVIEAYLAELDAFYAAANPPNPDHPALEETMTGAELTAVRSLLEDLKSRDHAIRRGSATRNDPRVTSVDRQSAVVTDCATDADVTVHLPTGDIVDDEVVHGRFTTRLVREHGRWKVAEARFEELEHPCEH